MRERLTSLGQPFPRRVSALDRAAALARRPLDRRALRGLAPLDEMRALGTSVAAAAPPVTGPRVLVLALRGWPNHCALETTIAQALRMRGADVALLTCGGGQPACEMGWGREAFPRPCDRCAWYTRQASDASGLPTFRLVDQFAWGADGRRAPAEPAAGDHRPALGGRGQRAVVPEGDPHRGAARRAPGVERLRGLGRRRSRWRRPPCSTSSSPTWCSR